MPTFKYRAKESSGATIEGFIEAQSNEEAIDKINSLGYLPMKVEQSLSTGVTTEAVTPSSAATRRQSSGKIRSRDITSFSQQMASLLRAGVPLLRALMIIGEPSESSHFKNLLNGIHDQINKGQTLSSSLAQYPKLFSPLYLALIAAGESSGSLDQVLMKITTHRQKQEEVFSRVRSALMYPALMALTGIGTIIFMLTFVMPRLFGIFSNLGSDLPLPTQILIHLSDALRQGWVWGVAGILALGVLILNRPQKTKTQKRFISSLQLGIPLIGSFILKSEVAKFSRVLELLLKSGIPIIKAIELAGPVVGNEILKAEFVRCLRDLKEGASFGKSLKKGKLFPSFMTNLVIIGEESGKLDEGLAEIAAFYERETDEALRGLTTLLEPLMILVMGLIVGFIVVAMLLPMFELNMMVK